MGSYRYFVGVVLPTLCVAPGCSNLIGLNGYSVGGVGGVDGVAGESEGRTHNDAGRSGAASGGETASGGSAGELVGDAGSGDSVNAGSTGKAGSTGTGGAPAACPDGCDDGNECTDDKCVADKCAHQPLGVGEACGMGQSCDGDGVCVRCLDTAPGTAQDTGCPATAPVCVGTGVDAVCGGCTKAADCDDGNECTTETCSNTKCVVTAVAAGEMCSKGVCNGAAPEKCVACVDDAPGTGTDSGCSAAKPVCDPADTACYECVKDADCVADKVSCTVETCTNHACTHVTTDSKCPASTDACKPSKCDAAVGCTTVTITPTSQVLIAADPAKGNGSFEAGTKPATGWFEDGPYYITKNCNAGCTPGSNSGLTYASSGKVLAWLGGIQDADIGDLNRVISLPAGASSLHVQADTNFQAASGAGANAGYFQVQLMDGAYLPIGNPLFKKLATEVQIGNTHVWTANGIDVTADVTAFAGTDISISFNSYTDPNKLSDFFIDNVRVSVTACQ